MVWQDEIRAELREIRLLLSSGVCSTQASCGSDPDAGFALKQRKAALVKPSVKASSSTLRVKDEAKLCSGTAAAWIRMAVAICMKDGPCRLHHDLASDDDACTAIQEQGACISELRERQICNLSTPSALPNSQLPIHTEHELYAKNQAVAVTPECAGDCDNLTGISTTLFDSKGNAGSAREDLALGLTNKPQEGVAPQAGAPKFSKRGSSLKVNMMKRENDITLVSSFPVSAVISKSFSDLSGCKASQAGGRINKFMKPMHSRESAQLSSTSSLTASSKSELLTERRNARDPLEVSCDNACSVTCTTEYGADDPESTAAPIIT
jgi:hypothetical protein